MGSYPVYHSVYETFELVEQYLDPGFHYHLAIARIWGEVARDIADSIVIPFDLRYEADELLTKYEDLVKGYGTDMTNHGIDLSKILQLYVCVNKSFYASQMHSSYVQFIILLATGCKKRIFSICL